VWGTSRGHAGVGGKASRGPAGRTQRAQSPKPRLHASRRVGHDRAGPAKCGIRVKSLHHTPHISFAPNAGAEAKLGMGWERRVAQDQARPYPWRESGQGHLTGTKSGLWLGSSLIGRATAERRGIRQAGSDGQPSDELAIRIREEQGVFLFLSAQDEQCLFPQRAIIIVLHFSQMSKSDPRIILNALF
jgi:hypothetical protein